MVIKILFLFILLPVASVAVVVGTFDDASILTAEVEAILSRISVQVQAPLSSSGIPLTSSGLIVSFISTMLG